MDPQPKSKKTKDHDLEDDSSFKYQQLSDQSDSIEIQSIKQLSLDDVLQLAGGMGAYQWVIFILSAIISAYSPDAIAMNFVGGHQDHWCNVEPLRNLSYEQQKYIAIPTDHEGRYVQCRMFDLNYTQFTIEDLLQWNRTSEIDVHIRTKSCNNGWVYDQSQYLHTVTSRLDLVCSDRGLVPLISTFFMLGSLFGAFISGAISDRYGRKVALCLCIILKLISSLMNTYPWNYAWVVSTRFIMGIANTSTYLTAFIYLMEVIPAKKRGQMGLSMSIAFSVGFMIWPIRAYFIRDDFYLQLTAYLPFSVLLCLWWFIDESPRWLVMQERTGEAEEIVKKMAAVNNCQFPEDLCFDLTISCQGDAETTKKTVIDVFKSPTLRPRILILFLHWITDSLMYYALSLNTSDLFGDVYTNTVISGAVEIPAEFAAIFLLNWKMTGRRLTCSLSLLFGGIASFLSIIMIVKDLGLANTVLSMVAKGFVAIGFNSIFVYTSEILPTEVRNAGAGAASSLSRIGSMAAPFFGSLMASAWPPLPPLIYGTFAVVSGSLTLLLPETNGIELFDTIHEAEDEERYKKSQLKSTEKLYSEI